MKQSSNAPAGRLPVGLFRHPLAFLAVLATASASSAQAASEANLVLPKLGDPTLATFLGALTGAQLLAAGLLV